MGLGKWIGGIAGFMAFGPLGALAGYALGSLFEGNSETSRERVGSSEGYGRRNSFFFSLMVMASYIIRADGKVMHSEMEFVRGFLRRSFGDAAAEEGNEILLRLFEERKRMEKDNPMSFEHAISQCGEQIRVNLNVEERLQLLNFLAAIAKSDGHICQEEIVALRRVAQSIGLSASEVDSMLSLGGETVEDAYKVLEIEPSATDAEVKAAYRKLALKHHPDRVAALGEDVRKAAEEKFQKINEAKERIFAERGLK